MITWIIGALAFVAGFIIGAFTIGFVNIHSYNKGWDEGYIAALEADDKELKNN